MDACKYPAVGGLCCFTEVCTVSLGCHQPDRYALPAQTRQYFGYGGHMVKMAVGAGQQHFRGIGPGNGSCYQGQQPACFRSWINDDDRSTGILYYMDVFPYGSYTYTLYHAAI
jgi:hypothetical protein